MLKISKFIGQDETIELAEDNQKNSLILQIPSLDTGECARISNDLSSNIQNKDQNNTSIEKIEVHSDKIKKGSKTYHAFSPDNKTKNPECKNENYRTEKNKRNTTDRLELKKHCPKCKKTTTHKEKK